MCGKGALDAVAVEAPRVESDLRACRWRSSACGRRRRGPDRPPLPAAFSRSAVPVLERRLATGELRLRAALEELGAHTVAVDAAGLVNVNTPQELRAL